MKKNFSYRDLDEEDTFRIMDEELTFRERKISFGVSVCVN